ncbi:hypothetical protein Tsubulata_031008, partial [Turnera subulata]
MNMAYGSSGVFDTWIKSLPNLTTQINLLKQVVNDEKLYTKDDFNNSIALELKAHSRRVVKKLAKNIISIHHMGVPKIGVLSLRPSGWLPAISSKKSSYKEYCSENDNIIDKYHNQLLQRSLQKLNRKSKNKQVYVLLDLYGAFMSAVEKHRHDAGKLLSLLPITLCAMCSFLFTYFLLPTSENEEYKNPLKPCCEGVGVNYSCGLVDKNGAKMYRLCKHPELSFFWDPIHPSQNGWHSIFLALQPSLYQLLK